MTEDTLTEFKRLGDSASFHFADDSCKEWGLAITDEAKAIAIFKSNPELQAEMTVISKGFLWSLPSTS